MSDAREDEIGGSMLKNLFMVALTAVVAVGIVYADQSTAKVVVQVNRTAASSGKQMYGSYCASCHGVDGRGNGPVAVMLRKQPADLSALSRNNGGRFPSEHVATVLEFGAENMAHGTIEMPVWGPVLGKMDVSVPEQSMRQLRVNNLTRYIESIQEK
jgi:mono/diheme cytochrome c family protein